MYLAIGGISLAESRRQFITNLIADYDMDKDGKLSRDEAARSLLLRTKQRPEASEFLNQLRAQSALERRSIEQTVDRLGGEIVAYRQDLTSSQNDVEVFKMFDTDESGVLDDGELQVATDLIMSKDEDGDECVSFQEFFPVPEPDPTMLVAVGAPAPAAPTPLATVADMIRDTSEPLLPRRLLKKYDRNRDLKLDAAEIGWPPERVQAVDGDGDGRLDAEELKSVGEGAPDIELEVDLRDGAAEGGVIRVVGTAGRRLDEAERLDFVKVAFNAAVVTFSHRNLDPVSAAVDSAMRQFNALDADANGYLGRDETMERIRFERGLFDLIDADGDDKIFADEMQQYVRARAEPASNTCRLNLYDTGYGFFMALDANADGRVSERERRFVAASLSELERDGQAGIAQTEPVRHFHIEFVRGGYQLFGPSEQLLAQTPAFQNRTPTGPIWFQRMDRNNDGDLSWNEFLGPREIFHNLDADVDSLIDAQEAAEAR
jgi:Ca2+-binding EF-hand superfamily protein